MKIRLPFPILHACLALLLVARASACLWDRDTLDAENARFPEVIDLITGNFPRHSREFHEWRVVESKLKLQANPKLLEAYDDLAVSQHKLGDHLAACETMSRKEKIQPGIYETYSNMGTFKIYTGELPKALDFINEALSINADAHFGREKYQKWLVEWAVAGKPVLTEQPGSQKIARFDGSGFAAYVISRQPMTKPRILTEQLRREAIKGVLGMMRFADFDNPLLQEALGDLLTAGKREVNAAHLASLAYLHASKEATDPDEKLRLTKKFDMVRITFSDGLNPEKIELELKERLAIGEKLAAAVREDELTWIREKKDVSAEFARKYLVPAKVD